MPTFQVTCEECGGEKWPTLAKRPEKYVCALCLAVPKDKREKRRESAQKAAEHRKKT